MYAAGPPETAARGDAFAGGTVSDPGVELLSFAPQRRRRRFGNRTVKAQARVVTARRHLNIDQESY